MKIVAVKVSVIPEMYYSHPYSMAVMNSASLGVRIKVNAPISKHEGLSNKHKYELRGLAHGDIKRL
jgi:hypothetical protein